jgi:3'-phosphoadenosine 5'-phosphosulfate sulfotransferase (PAPS reductase)/FAD synthetase
MNILDYDYYLVAFSGGKDSLALVLHLLEIGIPQEKIELWHHCVDGREGSTLFDWLPTESYCHKVAQALKIPIYFSWREGGLEKEILRENAPTGATIYETAQGLKKSGGNSSKLGTRRKFPQTSPDLSVRFCSSYAKISIMAAAIAGQDRFKGNRTIVLTGERRSESLNRAKYLEFEPHRTNCKSRHVDHWRPVIDWDDAQVWNIISRWRIMPFVSYLLGWSRASCMLCIFSSNNQLASAYAVAPERVQYMADHEKEFGVTIHRKLTVMERVAKGTPYQMRPEYIQQARTSEWLLPVVIDDWEMPLGAFNQDISGPS